MGEREVGARIKLLMDALGCNGREMAQQIGVQPGAISHILSGRNKPSFQMLFNLLTNYPNVNPEWLIMGKGAMLKSAAAAGLPADDLFASAPTDAELGDGASSPNARQPEGTDHSPLITNVNQAAGRDGEQLIAQSTYQVDEKASTITPATILPDAGVAPSSQNARVAHSPFQSNLDSGQAITPPPSDQAQSSDGTMQFTDVIILRNDGTFVRYRAPKE